MPKSLATAIEQLTRLPKDAPTRFDLYDLQTTIVRLTEAFPSASEMNDLATEVSRLSDQVDTLATTINNLATVVSDLLKRG